MNGHDYFDEINEKHMKLTQYDCYQSVTERIHEKCFDLQVCTFCIYFVLIINLILE